MKALTDPSGRIYQIEAEGFPVAEPLVWVDVPADTTTDDTWDGAAVVKYQPPAPLPPAVPELISDRQFFQALALAGAITREEAIAAVKTGSIPAALQAVLDTLPEDQRFGAEMLISGATIFERSHPMVPLLGAALGKSAADLDALWTAAAAL